MTAPPAGALEACPCCGGEAATSTARTTDRDYIRLNKRDTGYGVNCISCGLSNRGIAIGYATEADAIAAWNRRTHGPALLAALRLREGCSANTLKTLRMSADALESAAKCVGGDLAVVLNDRAMFARIARDDLARVLEEGE